MNWPPCRSEATGEVLRARTAEHQTGMEPGGCAARAAASDERLGFELGKFGFLDVLLSGCPADAVSGTPTIPPRLGDTHYRRGRGSDRLLADRTSE